MIDKSLFQKEVQVPFSGQKFTIRRVRFKDFMQQMGTLPVGVNNSVSDIISDLQEKAKAGDQETEDRISRFYLQRGVVAPKIWFGLEQECPPDQIYHEDLASDLDALVGEIITFSGNTSLKNMDEFFRGAGTGAVGPNGQEVQSEAVIPVTEGNT